MYRLFTDLGTDLGLIFDVPKSALRVKLIGCVEIIFFRSVVCFFVRKLIMCFGNMIFHSNISLIPKNVHFGSTQGPVPAMEGTAPGPPGRFPQEARGGLGPNISALGPKVRRACETSPHFPFSISFSSVGLSSIFDLLVSPGTTRAHRE